MYIQGDDETKMAAPTSPLASESDLDAGFDSQASPMESAGTSTTPNTEISPPDSPFQASEVFKDKRLAARKKMSLLTLEEKVREAYTFGG